ncbi:MAG: CbiX/SirB N-terminal domain-containing protein [Firmicutes bacterium]|nr:CbiX/SirB N-terminal domain-containing protein [Bacillota bacterium]
MSLEGVVLLGHGSRAAVDDANQFLIRMAEMVRAELGLSHVEPAFMNPRSLRQDLAGAVRVLVEGGVRRVVVVPVFLTNGLHLRRDIPAEVEKLRLTYPEVEFRVAGPLGCDPRILAVVLDRIREAV